MSAAEAQEHFLEAFVEARGNADTARKTAKVTRSTFYRWLREDSTFRKRLDEYRLVLADDVEDEAVKRVLSPQSNRGSDALLGTVLKGLKKERYGDADNRAGGVNVVYISGLRDTPRLGVLTNDPTLALPSRPAPDEAGGSSGNAGRSAPILRTEVDGSHNHD